MIIKATTAFVLQQLAECLKQCLPEKIIMEQSGHLSTDGVHSYERTTELQRKAESDVLTDVTTSRNNSALSEIDKLMLSIPDPVLKTTGGGANSFTFENMQGCTFKFCFQK